MILKINYFRGDLSDILAKKASLVWTYTGCVRIHKQDASGQT